MNSKEVESSKYRCLHRLYLQICDHFNLVTSSSQRFQVCVFSETRTKLITAFLLSEKENIKRLIVSLQFS